MKTGMLLHKMASPHPPAPSFTKTVQTTISPLAGEIYLHFYVPEGYRKNISARKYPVVVCYHGGGFTIGSATDDARWAAAVLKHTDAIVVCVDYRLAPEYPFPTAVDDGADAVLYLAKCADELGVDSQQIVLSGFSAGANMALTVPLKLQEYLSAAGLPSGLETESRERGGKDLDEITNLKIVAIVSWYPPTDYTRTRAERHKTNIRPDQALTQMFTTLFDQSYLYPPSINLSSPLLSPAVAPHDLLQALPDDILIYTCEWDDLRDEGERFAKRLDDEFGKRVSYQMIEGVPHGWDKSPNPFTVQPQVNKLYEQSLIKVGQIFTKS